MSLPGFDKVEGLSNKAFSKLEDLVDILMQHRRDNPVLSKILERKLGLKGNEIRAMISYMRCKGEPIGSEGKGYFFCFEADELNNTIGHIEARAMRLYNVKLGLIRAQGNLRGKDKLQVRLF